MFPLVFPLLANASAVTAIIGLNPVRAYPFGDAPQGVVAPYVTWQEIAGVPENNLSGTPPADRYVIDVNCWGDGTPAGRAQVTALAQAVRDAIEPHAHMTATPRRSKDQTTGKYRVWMQFDFWHLR